MRFQNTIIVVAAALITVPAFASTTTGEQPRGAKAERKICRTLDTTGSRMAKRVCHTKAEWQKIDRLN